MYLPIIIDVTTFALFYSLHFSRPSVTTILSGIKNKLQLATFTQEVYSYGAVLVPYCLNKLLRNNCSLVIAYLILVIAKIIRVDYGAWLDRIFVLMGENC